MAEVIFEPLAGISHARAAELGRAFYKIVGNSPRTIERLHGRFLNGVVTRYQTEGKSIRSVIRAASAPAEKLKAFAILETCSNEPVGMASIQPQLDLFEQTVPGPTRLMRKLGKSGLGTSVQLATYGYANVAAWTRAIDPEAEYPELRAAYSFLREESNGSWTITPTGGEQWFATGAVRSAGFTEVCTGRFDDLEAQGLQRVPNSILYRATPAEV